MRLWKALGLAGLAGVAATGVVIARNQRARAQLTEEQIRERLRRRVAEATADTDPPAGQDRRSDSVDSRARA